MRRTRSFAVLLMLALTLVGAPRAHAAQKPSVVDAMLREEVLARHALEREAHIDRNVDLLLSLMADDFVMIDEGEVRKPTRDEQKKRFTAYFGAVRFRKWDDVAPPAVRVSADGTLATVIVKKEVVIDLADAAPEAKPQRTVFAWMETWEKRKGRWMLVAVCSTRAPDAG